MKDEKEPQYEERELWREKSKTGKDEWRKKLINACIATPDIYSITILKIRNFYTFLCVTALMLKTWLNFSKHSSLLIHKRRIQL